MTCQLRVLGCSGGIGGDNRTTAFLLNQNILIDAGTGVADLQLHELRAIDHVFLTHAHLDHIACLPLLLDAVVGARTAPVYVHATEQTIQLLRSHIFNWLIWPDFTVIPSAERPSLIFVPHELGQVEQMGELSVTPLPAIHTVPAVSFLLSSKASSVVFSGDTIGGTDFWQVVNQVASLKALIIETAFADKEHAIADAAKHLCPSTLAKELKEWQGTAEVLITHLKPGESEVTIREVLELDHIHPIRRLLQGEIIEF
ncbi:3',5'-cyclic-nucleotide phosphodiesterase [Chitinibacter bivalviorum]|uniref:3',5'-cyclic-nucleotide phosphodiesterase n=1 Tax=Chitinibacter bivalviorum TaxID=2739434 RepID=A0A7H9BGL3_9NEIS|nr:3',5'-cyclic-nucleotide phosphodiesterase [Chitinibacter bivalviorum]QLG87081.1 3',5'-cyclic-nucleotide phosphodiesterase [Chitinibacter bivalviorum]